jgi:hypothetical protein
MKTINERNHTARPEAPQINTSSTGASRSSQSGLVREASAFRAQDILDLASGKILAIHIQNFFTPTAARKLGSKFLTSPLLSGYSAGKNSNEIPR